LGYNLWVPNKGCKNAQKREKFIQALHNLLILSYLGSNKSSTVWNTDYDNIPFFATRGHKILYYIKLYAYTKSVLNSHKKWQHFTNTFYFIFLFEFWDPELILNIIKYSPEYVSCLPQDISTNQCMIWYLFIYLAKLTTVHPELVKKIIKLFSLICI